MKVIFGGPSLFKIDLSCLKEFSIRDPIKQGDILKELRQNTTSIGIVDGYFENQPAVWHKEILYGLEMGLHIYGSSSLGALRAVECAKYGMIGVGKVFEAYKSGEIESDDAVAVVHAPKELGYEPLTEALVNINATLYEAYNKKVISLIELNELLYKSNKLYFKFRTYNNLLKECSLSTKKKQKLIKWLKFNKVNVKREDVYSLIEMMNLRKPSSNIIAGECKHTVHFQKLLNLY